MADSAQLRRELNELKAQMEKNRAASERRIAEIEAENLRRFRELKNSTETELEQKCADIADSYDRMLSENTDEAIALAERQSKEMTDRYFQLSDQLKLLIEQEKNELARFKSDQANIIKDMNERLERTRASADEALRKAYEAVRRISAELPVEWFFPGRISNYRTQLESASDFYGKEMYEAAAGIADNICLTVSIDEINVRRLFDKWYGYFITLSGIVENEHDLLIRQIRQLDGMDDYFYIDEGIPDKIMTEEMVELWSGKSLDEYRTEHDKAYETVVDIAGDLTVTKDSEKLKAAALRYLMKNYQNSGMYSSENMYAASKKSSERIKDEFDSIIKMRNEIKCYRERMEICAELCDIMDYCGFIDEPVSSMFENDDKRRAVIARFEDMYGYAAADIYIIPVFCSADGKWYNNIGYVLSSESDISQTEEMLRKALEDRFTDRNVLISSEMPNADITDDSKRAEVFSKKFRMTLNGHL